jgi:hypothetical protein
MKLLLPIILLCVVSSSHGMEKDANQDNQHIDFSDHPLEVLKIFQHHWA